MYTYPLIAHSTGVHKHTAMNTLTFTYTHTQTHTHTLRLSHMELGTRQCSNMSLTVQTRSLGDPAWADVAY